MNFDELLVTLGEFGRYQKRVYFLICLLSVSAGFHMVVSAILLATPKHRCKIPGYLEDTYEIQNDVHAGFTRAYIPTTQDKDGDTTYEKCSYYTKNASSVQNGQPEKQRCESWVYDTSVFRSTFTAEQNLVCDKQFWTSYASMIFFGGVLIGAFALGTLSDTFGRKKTLMLSVIMLLFSGMSVAWASNYAVFCFFRFLVGVSCAGLFMTGFVLDIKLEVAAEINGLSRAFVHGVPLMVVNSDMYGVWDFYCSMVAAMGHTCFSHIYLLNLLLILNYHMVLLKKAIEAILRNQNFYLPIRSVVSMVYYGLSLNSGNLAGDFYLNFFLSGMVEFPAYTLCLVLLDRVGRKKLHIVCMVVGGLACIFTLFPALYLGKGSQWVTVVLAMIGKLGVAAAFAVIYVWSAELFPTIVRNAGMGASSSCARIGGILSPLIADLSKVIDGDAGQAIPLVIFGGFSVLAGVLSFLLPGTLGQHLPETIDDGINFGKNSEDSSLDSCGRENKSYIHET